jgi:hypothetical protein
MMDWILLSGFGTAALLLAELLDFIRDRWPLRPQLQPNSLPVGGSAPTPQSARAPGAWQPAHGVATQDPRVTCRRMALNDVSAARWQHRGAAKPEGTDKGGWQATARRLAGEWTVLDGVVFQHAYVHEAAADTEIAVRRALSADQILSARINAAYAVWAAARSSQLYGG